MTKPSIVSTSPVSAYSGTASGAQLRPGISPPPKSSKRCVKEAQVTAPSHQAMLRTSIAPAQPTSATSGSCERLAHLRDEVRIDDLGVLVQR